MELSSFYFRQNRKDTTPLLPIPSKRHTLSNILLFHHFIFLKTVKSEHAVNYADKPTLRK